MRDQPDPRRETVPAGHEPVLLAQVATLVHEVTGLDPALVRPEAVFVRDLGVDSISLLEIIEGVGLRCGVHVRDQDTVSIKRVGDLVAYLQEHGPH